MRYGLEETKERNIKDENNRKKEKREESRI